MSPDLGRFLQPDPIGFKGDASNLYRYCGNDWANRTDPMGLFEIIANFRGGSLAAGNVEAKELTEALMFVQKQQKQPDATKVEPKQAEEGSLADKAGIEATKRAEKAMGDSGIPYSVGVLRNTKTQEVVYGDPMKGISDGRGGYREHTDFHHQYFEAFRKNPKLWNNGKNWDIFALGHTHPLGKSQPPGFSVDDRKMQSDLKNVPLYKNNPNWPGKVYDKRSLGPNGWEVRHLNSNGTLNSGPEPD